MFVSFRVRHTEHSVQLDTRSGIDCDNIVAIRVSIYRFEPCPPKNSSDISYKLAGATTNFVIVVLSCMIRDFSSFLDVGGKIHGASASFDGRRVNDTGQRETTRAVNE